MPMPHLVAVNCPSCSQYAVFTFSSFSEGIDRKDRQYFEKSKSFETEWVEDSLGRRNYRVWYDFGRGKKSLNVINDLPEGVSANHFVHSKYFVSRNNSYRGVIKCQSCNDNRLHKLNWPRDAYFKVNYKHHILWAFNRERWALKF
jgi:hypothetical protein